MPWLQLLECPFYLNLGKRVNTILIHFATSDVHARLGVRETLNSGASRSVPADGCEIGEDRLSSANADRGMLLREDCYGLGAGVGRGRIDG